MHDDCHDCLPIGPLVVFYASYEVVSTPVSGPTALVLRRFTLELLLPHRPNVTLHMAPVAMVCLLETDSSPSPELQTASQLC